MTKSQRKTMGIVGAALIALATAIVPSAFAGAYASGELLLVIRPQVALRSIGDKTVQVQIRLARETTASVWATEETCSTPAPAARTIRMSGTYEIPTADLGSGNFVCVTSSDGSLNAFTRVSNVRSPAGF